MPVYTHKVRDEKGNAIQGESTAPSLEAAVDRLHNLGYTIISVKPVSSPLSINLDLPIFVGKIKTEDYAIYTSQLGAMLGAGLPLTGALEVLVDQTENRSLKNATQKMAEDIKAGNSMANAMRKHPNVFNNLFINMVAAGEVAGNMEEVLNRYSTYVEKQADFQQKLSSAMFYPVILLLFSIVAVVFIVISVLPAFVKMFNDAGVPLPLPTLMLYNLNLFIRGYWGLLLAAIAGLFVFSQVATRNPTIKARLDRLTLKLPIWGQMSRKSEIAKFSRTLASLLNSGVPILQSLETLEKTTDNSVFAGVIRDCRDYVKKGGSLAEQLKQSKEFPAMPVKMIAVGEESGSLNKMLSKIADFYELSVDYAIKKFTSILEPLFLVLVGGLVGGILASVILPMFRMVTTIKRH